MASLYTASSNGDVNRVRSLLLQDNVDVDELEPGISPYKTPLIVASANNHLEIVNLLLHASANVDAEPDSRGSALLHACKAGHIDIVKALIAAGADFRRAQSKYQHGPRTTPLQLACRCGNTAVAELLLDTGEPINPTPRLRHESYTTPLYEAAAGGYPETVAMLLSRGADPNATSSPGSRYGLTSLYAATVCNIFEYTGRGPIPYGPGRHKEDVRDVIFQQLVDAGANLDDSAAFYQAASLAQMTIFKRMLDAGIDVDNSPYGNPLADAAGHGHLEIVSMLLRAGADVNHIGDDNPSALLQATFNEDEAMVRLLLQAGADTSSRASEYGDLTPLRLAAKRGMSSIVGILLAGGAAVDYEERDPLMYDLADEGGEEAPDEPPTALCLAAAENHMEIVNVLLGAGADVNADRGSVVIGAAGNGHDEIVRLLIGRGAVVDPPNDEDSPLWSAAFSNKLSTVAILVEEGALVNRVLPGLSRRNAVQAARCCGNDDVVRFLRSHGAVE